MTCNAHDLVLIPFPYADLGSTKRRPVIALTSPDHHGDFIALAVTTAPQTEPSIPLISEDLSDGSLPKPSWIRVDKILPFQSKAL